MAVALPPGRGVALVVVIGVPLRIVGSAEGVVVSGAPLIAVGVGGAINAPVGAAIGEAGES